MRRVLIILPARIPSLQILIQTPLSYLAQQGRIAVAERLENTVLPTDVAAADVIVTGRNSDPIYQPIYELAARRGVPIISEVDDNLFELPGAFPGVPPNQIAARRAYMEWLLRRSAIVRVNAARLGDRLAHLNPRIERVTGAIDWTLTPDALPPLADPLRLVYATSRVTEDVLFPQIAADLRRLLADFGERIRLHIHGYEPPEFRDHPAVVIEPYRPDYAAYFRAFTRAGYAIGFAPMLRDDYYMSKSNLKFRDYAAAGAVGLYLDCPVYRGEGGVIAGETGLLVSGEPGSWYAAAASLIADRDRLRAIRERAYAFARETYTLDQVAALWLTHIESLPPPRHPAADRLPDWWFTDSRSEPQGVARLVRSWYRTIIPDAARLRLREWRFALRSRLRRPSAL